MAMIAGVHYMKSPNTIGIDAKILNGLLNTKVRRNQHDQHDSCHHHSNHLSHHCFHLLDWEEKMKNNYKDSVERVLKEHPETRDDDHKLFVWVCYYEKPELLEETFSNVFWNHS